MNRILFAERNAVAYAVCFALLAGGCGVSDPGPTVHVDSIESTGIEAPRNDNAATAAVAGDNAATADAAPPTEMTHVVTEDCVDQGYATGEKLRLTVGDLVRVLEHDSSWCDIVTEDGQQMMVPCNVLRAIGDVADEEIDEQVKAVAEAANRFGFALYQQLERDDQHQNLFFSPTSLSIAVSMAYAGAGGETRDELRSLLQLEMPDAELLDGCEVMTRLLDRSPPGVGYYMQQANRLWCQEGFTILPEYSNLLTDRFGADMGTLDFVNEPNDAASEINVWAAKQTLCLIDQIVDSTSFTPLTRLVLCNALYFQGTWKQVFDAENTQEAPFHTSAETTVPVQMMHHRRTVPWAHIENTQILRLDYGMNGQLSMIILLPDKGSPLSELEAQLSPAAISTWLQALQFQDTEVYLPRFRIEADYGLVEILQEMGVARCFRLDQADFTGITATGPLALDAVKHCALVEVNERGTEAAAVTGLMAYGGIMEPPPEPVTFRADRPFVFLIQENRTGAILFLGRLMKP